MKILTFDTCLNKTYVTLSQDGEILKSVQVENKNEKYHSAYLISTIVGILKEFSLTMQNIDVIGTNAGPGSFTGIRACVTVSRVFAQQLQCPLVGVSSPEILSKLNKSDKNSVILLDARKNQFYLASYDKNGKEIISPGLIQAENVIEYINNAQIIADDSVKKYLSEKSIDSICYTDCPDDLGVFLNKIVYKKFTENPDNYFWAKLKPMYIQTPPISCAAKK